MTSFTNTLKQLTKNDALMSSREAMRWINERMRKTKRGPGGKFVIGGLYTFVYDPKTKNDLPYYDTFPMVIALDRSADGFLGLNLHYLPPALRAVFLDKLYGFAVLNDEDEIKRYRITYDILSATKKYKEFAPCLKQYLHSNVKSNILPIAPEEWKTTLFLPYEQFKKKQKQDVWQDSVNEIRNDNQPNKVL